MAQHDYVIANGTGAAVRSDLNNALAAIVSNNSGATEPATTYAYMWWPDTTTNTLKLRNGANNAWITLRELDGTLTIEDGTASSPGLAFADDLNTGIYSPSADQLGITTGGTVRLTTTTTGITSALPVDVPLGTASAPTVTFTGDTNTGIYSPGADQVAISTNGSGRLFVDSSGNVTINGQGDLRLADSDSSNWVAFQAPATVASNVTWTLPSADGTSGQVLVTNGSGTLSWGAGSQWTTTGSDIYYTTGRVGIGASTPNKLCELRSTDAATTLRVSNRYSANSGAAIIDFETLYGGVDGAYGYAEIGAVRDGTATNYMYFKTSGTERARIDSSGRLLVGTSSAIAGKQSQQRTLQIAKAQAGTDQGLGIFHFDSGGQAPNFELALSKNNTLGSHTVVSSGDNCGSIIWSGSDGSNFVQLAQIAGVVDGAPGANDMPGRLVFSTTADGASSPTERMRISQNGETVFYGNGSVTAARSNTGAGTGVELFNGYHSATGVTNGTRVIAIYTNGNIQNTNGSYTTLSDAKLKENIVDAGSQWDDLKAIQIRNWNFKAETGHETHRQIGPIAQELETVCPGLVFETPDRDADGNETGEVTKGVNQSVLYMKAVKALQEAMERIEQLESEMAAVKAQLA